MFFFFNENLNLNLKKKKNIYQILLSYNITNNIFHFKESFTFNN
jgi:hypothetical protein